MSCTFECDSCGHRDTKEADFCFDMGKDWFYVDIRVKRKITSKNTGTIIDEETNALLCYTCKLALCNDKTKGPKWFEKFCALFAKRKKHA
jgi:hypothetical protein